MSSAAWAPAPRPGAAPLRVGLVGYGYAGRTFHAPLLAAVPAFALAAVSSRDAARVLADWPGVQVHADPYEMLARADLDLIVIASPNDSHHPLARAALLAGRHVVVDKPFTLTLAQGRELEALAHAHGRVLSVFHNRRWDADFLTLAALLRAGTLGRVVEMESRFDRFRPEVRARWREATGPGSGLWFDLGPHLLDQALQLFGPPRAIALDLATLRDGARVDDWFVARLRYDGLQVALHAGTLVAAGAPRLAVHGTRGSFVKHGLDAQEDALKLGRRPGAREASGAPDAAAARAATAATALPWGHDPGPAVLVMRADADDADAGLRSTPLALQPGDYPAYYAALAEAVRGTGPNPVPAAQALDVMALLELGLASASARREKDWPGQ